MLNNWAVLDYSLLLFRSPLPFYNFKRHKACYLISSAAGSHCRLVFFLTMHFGFFIYSLTRLGLPGGICPILRVTSHLLEVAITSGYIK